MGKHKRPFEPHVRLYRHELDCAAYRDLSPDARALLVEFRALFKGTENRVYMSAREMVRRLGVGSHTRARKARDELVSHGFIRVLQAGTFKRKVRHASEFALTNEPLENRQGAIAPKDFMQWRSPYASVSQKNTVFKTCTVGAQNEHRELPRVTPKQPHGVQNEHRNGPVLHSHGAQNEHTDSLPYGEPFLWAVLWTSGETQFKVILGWILKTAAVNQLCAAA